MYVIVAEPNATPETTPVDAPTDAIPEALLVQIPPEIVLDRAVVPPRQTLSEPIIVFLELGPELVLQLARLTLS